MQFELTIRLDTVESAEDHELVLALVALEREARMRWAPVTVETAPGPVATVDSAVDLAAGCEVLRGIVREWRGASLRVGGLLPAGVAESRSLVAYVAACGGLRRAVSAVWSPRGGALSAEETAAEEVEAAGCATALRHLSMFYRQFEE